MTTTKTEEEKRKYQLMLTTTTNKTIRNRMMNTTKSKYKRIGRSKQITKIIVFEIKFK